MPQLTVDVHFSAALGVDPQTYQDIIVVPRNARNLEVFCIVRMLQLEHLVFRGMRSAGEMACITKVVIIADKTLPPNPLDGTCLATIAIDTIMNVIDG